MNELRYCPICENESVISGTEKKQQNASLDTATTITQNIGENVN